MNSSSNVICSVIYRRKLEINRKADRLPVISDCLLTIYSDSLAVVGFPKTLVVGISHFKADICPTKTVKELDFQCLESYILIRILESAKNIRRVSSISLCLYIISSHTKVRDDERFGEK